MVLDLAHPGMRRQQLGKMAAPARWVFAVAILAHFGKV